MTTFTIANLERNTDGDVVTTVHWVATKVDGEAVASVYSSMAVEPSDTFVLFANLTEETVVNWVKEKLDLESLESALDAQIAEQKQPTKASGLPWVTE
jgi:hypothetical protein